MLLNWMAGPGEWKFSWSAWVGCKDLSGSKSQTKKPKKKFQLKR